MKIVNLGIAAHVDAGKTSLTERLLFAAGVLDRIGRVDDGTTQTDSLDLERERGITIKSAVVSFTVDDVTVNLLDTPGHPDFIAEVERVLGVLDGAVLVISAVEGVQPQTRVLTRTLQRLRIPTVIFVNKIDRVGARDHQLVADIARQLDARVVAMGTVSNIGTRGAQFHPYAHDDPNFMARLADLLTAEDDTLLADYVADESAVSSGRLIQALTAATHRATVNPVYFGSAITGAGTSALSAGITRLLAVESPATPAPVDATVFKIDRGSAGEKVAYLRVFTGVLQVRDRVRLGAGEHKVTAIRVFDRGADRPAAEVGPGRIAKVWGLESARVGDSIGSRGPTSGRDARHFSPPTLATIVRPVRPADRAALHAALVQLAEQDPFIALRQDEVRHEIALSLYGEVQKEVIARMLADDFAVAVTFEPTTTICVEYPSGSGAAYEIIGTDTNPFLATIGLRVDPAGPGRGISFGLEVELGSMPYAFMRAVEDAVHVALTQGLHGWPVTDAIVTMTHSGYFPRQSHMHGTFDKTMSSTAGDFRLLTPLILISALRRAGTTVCEPIHEFTLRVPAAAYGAVLPVLTDVRAVPARTEARDADYWVHGTVPADRVHELQLRLPGVTAGQGVLESAFDHYRPVTGATPQRRYVGPDPRDRDAYLQALRQK